MCVCECLVAFVVLHWQGGSDIQICIRMHVCIIRTCTCGSQVGYECVVTFGLREGMPLSTHMHCMYLSVREKAFLLEPAMRSICAMESHAAPDEIYTSNV